MIANAVQMEEPTYSHWPGLTDGQWQADEVQDAPGKEHVEPNYDLADHWTATPVLTPNEFNESGPDINNLYGNTILITGLEIDQMPMFTGAVHQESPQYYLPYGYETSSAQIPETQVGKTGTEQDYIATPRVAILPVTENANYEVGGEYAQKWRNYQTTGGPVEVSNVETFAMNGEQAYVRRMPSTEYGDVMGWDHSANYLMQYAQANYLTLPDSYVQGDLGQNI